MTKSFAIYIENGCVQKNFAGRVYAMRYNPESGNILNECWVTDIDDYPSEIFEDCYDVEHIEYCLARSMSEDIERGDFSKLKRVNLGACSHIAIDSGNYGSPHEYWGDCEMRDD